jgi:hypothetical protein
LLYTVERADTRRGPSRFAAISSRALAVRSSSM